MSILMSFWCHFEVILGAFLKLSRVLRVSFFFAGLVPGLDLKMGWRILFECSLGSFFCLFSGVAFCGAFCSLGSLFGGLGESFGRSFRNISTLSWKKGTLDFERQYNVFA